MPPTTYAIPPSAAAYARAAKLREALRHFQRRSDELTSSNGLTTRRYQLLLMIKTARSGDGRVEPTELEERSKQDRPPTATAFLLASTARHARFAAPARSVSRCASLAWMCARASIRASASSWSAREVTC